MKIVWLSVVITVIIALLTALLIVGIVQLIRYIVNIQKRTTRIEEKLDSLLKQLNNK